jgi:hypothetical protein
VVALAVLTLATVEAVVQVVELVQELVEVVVAVRVPAGKVLLVVMALAMLVVEVEEAPQQ